MSSPIPITTRPARVSQETFLGVSWGLFALATILGILRCAVRYKTFHQFHLDDFFAIVAWALALAHSIIWQCTVSGLYLNNQVTSGLLWPLPPDFTHKSETFLRASAACQFIFLTSLWCVKLSFLCFFRRLYLNMGRLMRIWWVFAAFTFVSWIAAVGTIQYWCLTSSLTYIMAQCKTSSAIYFQRTTLVVKCVVDVVSDIMIISIPINMLWNVHISLRRKLALGSIFSVTIITIAFSIIRVAVVDSTFLSADMSWLFTWDNIEMMTALIVASLGSFRTLFTTRDSAKHAQAHLPSSTTGPTTPSRRLVPPYFRNLTDFLSRSSRHCDTAATSNTTGTINGIISLYGSAHRSEEQNELKGTGSDLETCQVMVERKDRSAS